MKTAARLAMVLAVAAAVVAAVSATRPARADPRPWADAARRFRVLVSVGADGHARTDAPADVKLNFTSLLRQVTPGGVFDPASLHVVEVDSAGAPVDASVPFQFDPDTTYDPSRLASGDLVIILKGPTAPSTRRRYDVYFDTAGRLYVPVPVAPQISLTDNVPDAGQTTFRIGTPSGTWYFDKVGGAFTSLVDPAGRDWISYDTTPGSGSHGLYRGMPNMNDRIHAGAKGPGASATTLEHAGPLKLTYRFATADGWVTRWEVYPSFARMTVAAVPLGGTYYLLYEGTPGGKFSGNDTMTWNDGTATGKRVPLSARWDATISSPEWAYFSSMGLNRSYFMAHGRHDGLNDVYWDMNDEMTVFGFGRVNWPLTRLLTATGDQLTVGLMDTTDITTAPRVITGAIEPLTISVGPAQPVPEAS